jgi:hypothetical protein
MPYAVLTREVVQQLPVQLSYTWSIPFAKAVLHTSCPPFELGVSRCHSGHRITTPERHTFGYVKLCLLVTH